MSAPRRKPDAIDETEHEQQRAPPHIRMQVEEYHSRICRGTDELINSFAEDQRAIHRQRDANKKPNRDHPALRLPKNNVQRDENNCHYRRPEKRLLIEGNVSNGGNFREAVNQSSQLAVGNWFGRQTH